jgi:hypothetical protein
VKITAISKARNVRDARPRRLPACHVPEKERPVCPWTLALASVKVPFSAPKVEKRRALREVDRAFCYLWFRIIGPAVDPLHDQSTIVARR